MAGTWNMFWILAGAWNIFIATFLWNELTRRNKKVKESKVLRAIVFAFGVGYILVGYFNWMWWFILLGIVAKLGIVLDYFGNTYDFEKLKLDLMTYIMIGDLLWVFGFGAMLGMKLSLRAQKNRL